MLTNCQVEEDVIVSQEPIRGDIRVQTVSFSEIESQPDIISELNKNASIGGSYQRMRIDSEGFFYDDADVLKIEYKDYTTYNFLLYRFVESRLTENLVIRKGVDGKIDSFITTYNLSEQDLSYVTDNKPVEDILNKSSITARGFNGGRTIYKRPDGTCFYVTVYDENGNYCATCYYEVTLNKCPEEYIDLSVTESDNSGGGGGTGGGIVVYYITYPPVQMGPVTPPVPGGITLHPSGSNYPRGLVLTRPFANAAFKAFVNSLTFDQRSWLAGHDRVKQTAQKLLSAVPADIQKRSLALKMIVFGMQGNEQLNLVNNLSDYLDAKNNSDESLFHANSIMTYVELYNNYDSQLVNDLLNSLTNPSLLQLEEEIDIIPSCESFNFQNTSSNWQEAAVKNIKFLIVVVNPEGLNINQNIQYTQPVLFGCPRNLLIGNTNISAGLAATLSAKALSLSMKQTVKKFGTKPVTEELVRIYFESRLKYNYPLFIPGARVNFNPNNYSVTPTQYQSNLFSTGDCD